MSQAPNSTAFLQYPFISGKQTCTSSNKPVLLQINSQDLMSLKISNRFYKHHLLSKVSLVLSIEGNSKIKVLNKEVEECNFFWSSCYNLFFLKIIVPSVFQGQAGWDFDQPGIVGSIPVHGRGLELDDLLWLNQIILWLN